MNIIQIIILYRERQELKIPAEIQDLYDSIFHAKSHREFLFSWNQGKICQAEKETLITSGDTQTDLMLILNGKGDVVRDGEKMPHWKEASSLRKSVMLQESQLLRMLFLKVV